MPENEMTGNLFLFARSDTNANVLNPTTKTIKPEERLVELICVGDEAAFGELYRMFAPLVHGITLARVPRDEVDDIVQEVFISAYKNINTLRDKSAVGAWLAMIARNRAVEFYRQMKPTEELSEAISGGEKSDSQANEILQAIRALPETYKETLVLRLVEGMTGAEIAERTGLTPESVRVNLHRGMKLLREKLDIEVKR